MLSFPSIQESAETTNTKSRIHRRDPPPTQTLFIPLNIIFPPPLSARIFLAQNCQAQPRLSSLEDRVDIDDAGLTHEQCTPSKHPTKPTSTDVLVSRRRRRRPPPPPPLAFGFRHSQHVISHFLSVKVHQPTTSKHALPIFQRKNPQCFTGGAVQKGDKKRYLPPPPPPRPPLETHNSGDTNTDPTPHARCITLFLLPPCTLKPR